MFAPESARKPATAATIPCRSGQVMSRRPFMRARRLLRPAPATRRLGERVAPAGRQDRVDVALRAVAVDRAQREAVEHRRRRSRGTSVTASAGGDEAADWRAGRARPSRQARLEAGGAAGAGDQAVGRCGATSGSSARSASVDRVALREPVVRRRARPGTARAAGRGARRPSCSRRGSAASWKRERRCSSPRRDALGQRVAVALLDAAPRRPGRVAQPATASGTSAASALGNAPIRSRRARRRPARRAACAASASRSASASACSSSTRPARRELQPAGLAVEQPRADLRLQRRDLLGDRRLGQRERARRGARTSARGRRPGR